MCNCVSIFVCMSVCSCVYTSVYVHDMRVQSYNYLPVKPYANGKSILYSSCNSVITTKILEVCDN